MESNVIVLPQEVEQLAQNVSPEKRTEVQAVLNQVFVGVSKMREQLDNVVVEDENDKVNMKLANTIRLGVRSARLSAEKVFDAKRAEVQQAMISYKTEDSLWLKAKQTMQILTQEIEKTAKWKEETRERIEAERMELKTKERELLVSKYDTEISRAMYQYMTDDIFATFLQGIEKAYNDKIEAHRLEDEQRIAKEKADKEERERIAKENEKLKAELEAREKEIAKERAKIELERKAAAEKQRKELEAQQQKLKAEREAREKLEKEAQAKAAADQKAQKDAELKAIAEQKARDEAIKKANAAPDKIKLNEFADFIDGLQLPTVNGQNAQSVLNDTKTLLLKVSAFIRSKSDAL